MDNSSQNLRAMMKEIAEETYNTLGTQYNVPNVPVHVHTGIDTNKISYKAIVQGTKYTTGISENATQTTTIGGVTNPTRILFQGFAANNNVAPATKIAIINGEINFGTCFEFSDLTPPLTISTSGAGEPYIQSCNYMYVDSADLTKNRVGSTEGAVDYTLTATGAFGGGETAATLTSNWGGNTTTKEFIFSNNDVRLGVLTHNSASVTWTTALSSAASSSILATSAFFIFAQDDTGAVVALARVTNYNNQIGVLTVSFIVGLNWVIQGAFTIT